MDLPHRQHRRMHKCPSFSSEDSRSPAFGPGKIFGYFTVQNNRRNSVALLTLREIRARRDPLGVSKSVFTFIAFTMHAKLIFKMEKVLVAQNIRRRRFVALFRPISRVKRHYTTWSAVTIMQTWLSYTKSYKWSNVLKLGPGFERDGMRPLLLSVLVSKLGGPLRCGAWTSGISKSVFLKIRIRIPAFPTLIHSSFPYQPFFVAKDFSIPYLLK